MDFFKNLFGGIGSAVGNIGSGIMNLFGGGGGSQPQAQPQRMAWGNTVPMAPQLSASSLWNSPYQQGAGALPKTVQPQSNNNDWWSQMTKGMNIPQMALGGGINLLGQMTAPKVKTPDIRQSGGYQGIQNFNYQMPPGAEAMIMRAHDRTAEEERRRLRNIYKNVRPGTDYTTDSTYIRDAANLDRALEQRLADELTKGGLSFADTELGRFGALQDSDAYQQALESGQSSQEAEQYKQSFSNIGSMLLNKGMGNTMDAFTSQTNPLENSEEDATRQSAQWQNLLKILGAI